MSDKSVETNKFIVLLKDSGHFVTKPRLELFAVLQKHEELTVLEIISLLKDHDQAIVYRNIKVLESLGVINRLRLGWNSKLELSDVFQHHHHHISCLRCGKVVPMPENKELENNIKRLSRQNNFKVMDHQLEIRGLCHSCQKS